MMLFNFQLRPLTEVGPFGRPPHLRLGWFGLTDGWYWMDVGGEQLFKYTPVVLQYWQRTKSELGISSGPGNYLDCYVDYYVVRLWEDILDLLPAMLEPIPAPLVGLLNSQPDWDAWHETFLGKLELEDDEEAIDLYIDAIDWWRERKLSTTYLRHGPDIRFWSNGTDLVIDWDNRGMEIEGNPVWTASWGRSRIPLQSFLEALTSFDRRLMEAMAARVEAVLATWSRPDVYIDFDRLQQEQRERATWLEEALDKAKDRSPTRWDYVLDLLHRFEML